MIKTSHLGLRIAVLVIFAAVALGIGFFHTETGPGSGNDCPACHFLSSSASVGPGIAFLMPIPVCLGVVSLTQQCPPSEVFALSLCSRSPPQA
jgi:hypothetical protein